MSRNRIIEGPYPCLHRLRRIMDGCGDGFRIRSPLDFKLALFDALDSHRHPDRKTEEIRVVEFDSGPFVPVIQENVDAVFTELSVEPFSRFDHCGSCIWRGRITASKGAMGMGKTIPFWSWFCSMAAATVLPTPIP